MDTGWTHYFMIVYFAVQMEISWKFPFNSLWLLYCFTKHYEHQRLCGNIFAEFSTASLNCSWEIRSWPLWKDPLSSQICQLNVHFRFHFEPTIFSLLSCFHELISWISSRIHKFTSMRSKNSSEKSMNFQLKETLVVPVCAVCGHLMHTFIRKRTLNRKYREISVLTFSSVFLDVRRQTRFSNPFLS